MPRLLMGLLAVASLLPQPAGAQDAPGRPQALDAPASLCAVRRVPQCRNTVATFEELSAVLTPGQQLIVTDESGRVRRGKILSISPSDVVIERQRFIILTERNRYDGLAVNEVRFRDSTLNGALLGILGGIVVTGALSASEEENPIAVAMILGLLVPSGAVIGDFVDGLKNALIYERAPRTPEVRVAPLAGPRSAGLALSVRF